MFQVIQFVTFLSPIVGVHLILEKVTKNHPQEGQIELPGKYTVYPYIDPIGHDWCPLFVLFWITCSTLFLSNFIRSEPAPNGVFGSEGFRKRRFWLGDAACKWYGCLGPRKSWILVLAWADVVGVVFRSECWFWGWLACCSWLVVGWCWLLLSLLLVVVVVVVGCCCRCCWLLLVVVVVVAVVFWC